MLLGSAVTADAAASASPLTYATDAMPPTLLFQGTEDILIGTGGAVTFYEALRAAAMPCELHLVAGVNHEFDVTPTHDRRLRNDHGELLHRHVVDPEGFSASAAETNMFAAIARATCQGQRPRQDSNLRPAD